MDRITDPSDAAYHRWGGDKPALPSYRHKSPDARLVGKTVELTRDLGCHLFTLRAGSRATVIRAYRGLTLQAGGDILVGVPADAVREVGR